VNSVTLSDWAAVYAAMGSPTGCTVASTDGQGYSYVARAAMTGASHSAQTGAPAAFTWLDGQLDAATVFKNDLTFGLVPGPARTTYVPAENGVSSSGVNPVVLSICPNPVNPGALVRLSGLTGQGRAEVTILDIRGRCADRMVTDAASLSTGVQWIPRRLAGGVYMFQVECNGMKARKRVMIVR
jgi:hypothetical protein